MFSIKISNKLFKSTIVQCSSFERHFCNGQLDLVYLLLRVANHLSQNQLNLFYEYIWLDFLHALTGVQLDVIFIVLSQSYLSKDKIPRQQCDSFQNIRLDGLQVCRFRETFFSVRKQSQNSAMCAMQSNHRYFYYFSIQQLSHKSFKIALSQFFNITERQRTTGELQS